jgi:hypothetical protein
MHARAARLAVLAACMALGTAGCADKRIEHGVFRAGNYLVAVPSGWQVESDSRADLALARQGAPGGMLVHATCEGRTPRRTLDVLMRHLLFGLKDRRIVERADVMVNGYPAERAVFEGNSEGRTVWGEAYVVKADECVYDLLYIAPPEFFDQGREDFDRVVRSLRRT